MFGDVEGDVLDVENLSPGLELCCFLGENGCRDIFSWARRAVWVRDDSRFGGREGVGAVFGFEDTSLGLLDIVLLLLLLLSHSLQIEYEKY